MDPIAVPAAPGSRCPQCGGPVVVRDETPFATCGHCRATLWLDLGRLVRHSVLRPRLGAGEAHGALVRALRAGEVDSDARGPAPRLEFHPWFQVPTPRGPRLVAAGADDSFLAPPRRAAEAGDTDPADPALLRDAVVLEAVIDADEAVSRVEGGRSDGSRLVHVPVWRVDFDEGGHRYTAHVDAVEGDVSTLVLPPASTRRLDSVAALWMAGAVALFAVEAALLDGLAATLIGAGVTAAALWFVVRRAERGTR